MSTSPKWQLKLQCLEYMFMAFRVSDDAKLWRPPQEGDRLSLGEQLIITSVSWELNAIQWLYFACDSSFKSTLKVTSLQGRKQAQRELKMNSTRRESQLTWLSQEQLILSRKERERYYGILFKMLVKFLSILSFLLGKIIFYKFFNRG